MSRRPIGDMVFVHNNGVDFREMVNHLGSSYERCNLWPEYESEEEFLEILREEVQETLEEAAKIHRYAYQIRMKNASYHDLKTLRGMAIKVMLEAVQVVSVLDKYEACKDRANLAEEKPNE